MCVRNASSSVFCEMHPHNCGRVLIWYLPIVFSTWKPKPFSDFAALCISASFLPNADWKAVNGKVSECCYQINQKKSMKNKVIMEKRIWKVTLTWLPLDAPNSINSIMMYEPPVGRDPTYTMHATISSRLHLWTFFTLFYFFSGGRGGDTLQSSGQKKKKQLKCLLYMVLVHGLTLFRT